MFNTILLWQQGVVMQFWGLGEHMRTLKNIALDEGTTLHGMW